ncbi:MAG: alkaline phosphatase [Planctomycetaceae bacterium]|nr:alkaline phosphatase [Planctomycetaceae bacterium]
MKFPLSTLCMILLGFSGPLSADHIRNLQEAAVNNKSAEFGHWGWEPDQYLLWGTHSNRLIPIYTFGTKNAGKGIDLSDYKGKNSPYRDAAKIEKLYDTVPHGTQNPNANYADQTNIADIQLAALKAGKKHIILVVFDGMDWQTTYAAALHRNGEVAYKSGRGQGLHFQDYDASGTSQFGFMVTSPYVDDATLDVNTQQVKAFSEKQHGGYAAEKAGATPWAKPSEPKYLVGQSAEEVFQQAYTDSASSATSMTAGIKTYNASINVDAHGKQVKTVAHLAQEQGYRVGVVTSVPISHATPAAAYAHNVHRNDYQDLTRDLLGLPSISHLEAPLPGVDLLIGAGFGVERAKDSGQGENFVPGNTYLTEQDRQAIDARNGGNYVVSLRQEGVKGAPALQQAAEDAIASKKRLFGYYGVSGGHLPFQTADGQYDPPIGRSKKAESYTEADQLENPTLAEMATVSLNYLSEQDSPFWLMVEAGDVDWANHDNNIDNSIGAVYSGEAAVKAITDWVEQNSSWDQTVLIVTADHGHFLVLERPELLTSGNE